MVDIARGNWWSEKWHMLSTVIGKEENGTKVSKMKSISLLAFYGVNGSPDPQCPDIQLGSDCMHACTQTYVECLLVLRD